MNSKSQPTQSQLIQPNTQTLAAQTSTPNNARQTKINVSNAATFATPAEVKQWIKAQAQALGFADCGFLSVHHPLFIQQTERLQHWLAKG